MRNKHLFLLTFMLFLCSCKKDEAPPLVIKDTSLNGTWNFVGKRLENFREDLLISDTGAYRFLNLIGYLSKTASGKLIIENNTFRYDSAYFYADSIAMYKSYYNGALVDSTTAPLTGGILQNHTASYTLFDTDSIYVNEGTETGVPGLIPPIGYHIAWSGDTLLLISRWGNEEDYFEDSTHVIVHEYNIDTWKYVKQ
jgi:hypothetical protein